MSSRRNYGGGAAAEVVSGPHAALEALRAGKRTVHRLILAREGRGAIVDEILTLARGRSVPIEVRPRPELDRQVRGATHQGVLLEVGPFPYVNPETLVTELQEGAEPGFLLILDGIQDPQNLGAIVRSAEAAGVQGCILPRDRAAGVGPAAVRASAGATEHMPIGRVTNLAAFLELIRSEGFWVVGTDAVQGRDLFTTDLRGRVALAIGGEERGLRPLTKDRCDMIVRIPSRGRVGSLNASAAAAVCLFEIARQRAERETSRRS